MAGTIGGFGLIVKIDIASTLTAITYLLDGELPKFKKFLAEATPQNAAGGYAVRVATGKRSLESFKVTLGWDSDETTHAAVLAAFDSDSPVNMSVISPGTDETIAFSAHIEEIGRVTKDEDAYKAEIVITPTGAPTIT
mgnify:CR=1 FL=1